MFRRVEKIRARLGWPPGIASPDGSKPPRMHLKTYKALTSELDKLTRALLVDLKSWLDNAETILDRR
jgi:hypothetical protein